MFAYAQNELKDPWEKSGEYWLNLGQSNNVIVSALRALLKHCGINKAMLTYTPPEQDPLKFGFNRIIFGAPGTGKNCTLNKQAKNCFNDNHMERVTFHPEYTYFDFVGSYKPVMIKKNEAEEIGYRFVPGPFAFTLREALQNSATNYCLIIEEINRARVAAVFGDIFQLLDRNGSGESEYEIMPALELARYLQDTPNLEDNGIKPIRIPKNLYIWATMNSADQGVYPLDTAFKRRWSFEYIDINAGEDDVEGNDDTVVSAWKKIRTRINDLLQEAGVNEDKQLGPFFLHGKELENGDSFLAAFKSKVLMYLYEDSARHIRDKIFKTKGIRYSKLCEAADSLESLRSLFKEIGDGQEGAR